MPGENCSIVNCGTNRRHKGLSLFSLPNKKSHEEWREKWLAQLKRFREPNAHFQELIKKNHVYVCEKHFYPNELEYCKFLVLGFIAVILYQICIRSEFFA